MDEWDSLKKLHVSDFITAENLPNLRLGIGEMITGILVLQGLLTYLEGSDTYLNHSSRLCGL